MIVTWTAVRAHLPAATCPYEPPGATWWQAGAAGAGRVELPAFDGSWWSVLATWPDLATAQRGAPDGVALEAWHVVLQGASFRGDAVLGDGATPFASLPEQARVSGASAVVTLAGLGQDRRRTAEFLERVVSLGQDIRHAPGHRASLIQAPAEGAVMTFSTWTSLREAVAWAYQGPAHAATIARQEEHHLLETGGFLRCAVLSSHGSLGGAADPLAGLTGTVGAAA